MLKKTAALTFFAISTSTVYAEDTSVIKDNAIPQIQMLESDRSNQTPEQKKIATDLLAKVQAVKGVKINGIPNNQAGSIPSSQAVAVDVITSDSKTLGTAISKSGGSLVPNSVGNGRVTAVVPISQLEEVAKSPSVKWIQSTSKMRLNRTNLEYNSLQTEFAKVQGPQDSEGDEAHDAANARTTFKVSGIGVKIGVLSDSVQNLAYAQKQKSLGPVHVLTNQSGVLPPNSPFGTDHGEGTAMLEIIHRLAPGSELYFATANFGQEHMANNIKALVKLGCNIIVDDISYSDESPFQDGPIAKAINKASDKGVLYFSSAANSGNLLNHTSGTWEGDFSKGEEIHWTVQGQHKNGFLHLFAAGQQSDLVKQSGQGDISLFWNDPLNNATNEYDLFVLDPRGNVLTGAYATLNAQQDPLQFLRLPGAFKLAGQTIAIVQTSGASDRHLYLDTDEGELDIGTNG